MDGVVAVVVAQFSGQVQHGPAHHVVVQVAALVGELNAAVHAPPQGRHVLDVVVFLDHRLRLVLLLHRLFDQHVDHCVALGVLQRQVSPVGDEGDK